MDAASLHRRLERLALLLTGRPDRAQRIVRSVASAHLTPRRRRRGPVASPDHLERQVLLACRRPAAPAAAGPPDGAFEPLEGLPAQLREAFVLVRVLGRSLREAARAMDCSRTAVRRHLGRADQVLRAAGATRAAAADDGGAGAASRAGIADPAGDQLARLVAHLRTATWNAPASAPVFAPAGPDRRRRRVLAAAVVVAIGGAALVAWQGWRMWSGSAAAAPAEAASEGDGPPGVVP